VSLGLAPVSRGRLAYDVAPTLVVAGEHDVPFMTVPGVGKHGHILLQRLNGPAQPQ
jgi:hypothetical protein